MSALARPARRHVGGADHASPPLVTTPTHTGNISLHSAEGQLSASAIFPLAASDPHPLAAGCAVSSPSSGGTAPSSGTFDSASAGDIVIDVASRRSLTLSFDAAQRAYVDDSLQGVVPGGSSTHVRAAGAAGSGGPRRHPVPRTWSRAPTTST